MDMNPNKKQNTGEGSSRLIYAWYSQYSNGFVRNQGIFFNREYQINTDVIGGSIQGTLKVRVDISKNNMYLCPSDFYGENISSLTAIIGENGSGKTTIASMLMDYPIPSINGNVKSPFFWVVVTGEGDFIIYCFKVDLSFDNTQISIKQWEDNPIAAIYLTNLFNFSELSQNTVLEDLRKGNRLCRQIYSPANLLHHAREKSRKERYGYRTHDNKYLESIQRYADLMEQSDVQAYVKKQEELIIECYRMASDEIKNELQIFDFYEIEIIEFARDFPIYGNIEYEDRDQKIVEAKKCYIDLKKRLLQNQKDNFWLNVYVLALAESYLALSDIKNEEAKELKNRIKGADKIDSNMIQVLRKTADILRETPWALQIHDCLEMLEQYEKGEKADWKLGKQSFKYTEEMIVWYYEELKRTSSFFKRNLSFKLRPTSSGEQAMVNLFSYIVDAINSNPQQREFLLIIDEIDAGLHPRWQQKIIMFLLDWLSFFDKYQFQVIVTSHSPIVLSDILKEHVVKLRKNFNGHLVAEGMTKSTFGANIAMQFLDAFYMDNGNIGAFSKEKIRALIKEIEQVQDTNLEKRKELMYLVDSIGEDMVRKKLLNDILRKESGYDLFMKIWENSSVEERNQIISYLENLSFDVEE